MTFPIIEMVDSIDVIELDKDLANYLNEHDRKGLINVIQTDAMRFDFASLKKKKKDSTHWQSALPYFYTFAFSFA